MGVGVASLLLLAACGSDNTSESAGGGGDGGDGSASGTPWILGTTDTPTSLDPAGAYDLPSWTLQNNLYETLVTIPAGENEPTGAIAESCQYDDPKTYTCTLKEGQTFSNGNELTSSDVKFSIDRLVDIADPNGASSLFGSLDSVEAPDPTTVTFNLARPDTTFQFVLTTAAASIVDEDVFPADQLIGDSDIVGSGPYMLEQYHPENQAVLSADPEYTGDKTPKAEQVFVQYFAASSALKLAVQQNEVDVAWRSLSPTDIKDLEGLLLRGFIDRLDVAPSGAIRVVDYKTGRAPREAFEAKALFQMKFYALVLWRTRGVVPAMLQLVYLGSGELLRYQPDERDLLATERKVEAIWKAISRAQDSHDWRPRKSALCGWCPSGPVPRVRMHSPTAPGQCLFATSSGRAGSAVTGSGWSTQATSTPPLRRRSGS